MMGLFPRAPMITAIFDMFTTTRFRVSGMHCRSCSQLIEKTCKDIIGVSACAVDQKTGEATATHDGTVALETLSREIAGLGDYRITAL